MLLQRLTGGEQNQWVRFLALPLEPRTSFCSVFVLCLAHQAPSPLLSSADTQAQISSRGHTILIFSFSTPTVLTSISYSIMELYCFLTTFFAYVFYIHLPTLQTVAPLNQSGL